MFLSWLIDSVGQRIFQDQLLDIIKTIFYIFAWIQHELSIIEILGDIFSNRKNAAHPEIIIASY